MYRINFGTGSVAGNYESKREALKALAGAREECPGAWLEKYEPGDAIEPGEWQTADERTRLDQRYGPHLVRRV